MYRIQEVLPKAVQQKPSCLDISTKGKKRKKERKKKEKKKPNKQKKPLVPII